MQKQEMTFEEPDSRSGSSSHPAAWIWLVARV